jgi:hypothetical protein
MDYIDFFSNLGFNFKNDLKPSSIEIEKNQSLSKKLANSVFFYKNPNNTNTSFYLITVVLSESEIELLRKHIWNKNDADLIFYSNASDKIEMLYAKYSPKIKHKESILDSFSASIQDLEKIENIKQWQFDSGIFWLNYYSLIDKNKYKGIDKELVSTLKALKEQLFITLYRLISDENKCNEVVQALIDRTLYIKYLEDNHIINSHFYKHYFNDFNLNYETLLRNNSGSDLNKLFKKIHEIFNNALFDQPTIDVNFLNYEVCNLIATSFSANLNTGQLRLYDFQFDILPVEFISYIYEVFLSEKQKENGIYYTPKKLAQLIVDEVINEDKIGAILDPSSGSGMFLIVGYQRLLEIAQKHNLEPANNIDKIKFRIKLLSENIFGIEKEAIAQRFTLFSLSLQIFTGINPIDIKEFIANELKENKKIDLFSEYSFFENIKHSNSLDISENPFEGKSFSYLVGNPPFFEIPNTDEYKSEISFLNNYTITYANKKDILAKNIVGRSQISQCFFLKIKDWSNENTRLGFVSNSSNFYNDYSQEFQEYFYSNYGIEKIYELSKVKKILFEKAKESVLAIIFTNKALNNIIKYYYIELGLFSEKPFELLIIQEDKFIEFEQLKLKNTEIRLRDFLIGNEYDNDLIKKLNSYNSLESYIQTDNGAYFLHRGIEIVGFEEIKKEFDINEKNWESFSQKQKKECYDNFRSKYSSIEKTFEFNIPFIKPINIEKFIVSSYDSYLGDDISMFHRPRKRELYEEDRIVWSRIGKSLKAVYIKDSMYFDFDLYVLKLKSDLYHLIVAILNSDLVNYYINIHLKKRMDGSFPKIGMEDIKKVPIPKEIDQNFVSEISTISKGLTEGKFEYTEIEHELNELIFNLYELSYWEKQRIRDYFLTKEKIGRKKNKLEVYKETIKDSISFYLENDINIEESTADFNLRVIKISLNSNSINTPKVDKVRKYILNEIFEQNSNGNFLASQEKIYSKDCVYIIKEDINKNWTETKAFEDGQDILKHLMLNYDGERVY